MSDNTSRDSRKQAVMKEFITHQVKLHEERRETIEPARQALKRLVQIFGQRTGQSYTLRALLYSLYNGHETSLLEIVGLDWALHKDFCAVLLAFGYESAGPFCKGEEVAFFYDAMKAEIVKAGQWEWFIEAFKEEEVA